MQKLTIPQFTVVCAAYLLGVIHILTDQFYIPQGYRPAALIAVMLGISLFLFFFIKTDRPLALSNTLALVLTIFVIPLYVVSDLLIENNFTLNPVLMSLSAFIFPYLTGCLWLIVKKIKRAIFHINS
jgi:hypothetical protein